MDREVIQKIIDTLPNEVKSALWLEGRNAAKWYTGHYYDCCGYEDCYSARTVNPYAEGLPTGPCGDYETHEPHVILARAWDDTPDQEFQCSGFTACDNCYYREHRYETTHVCEDTQ